MTLLANILAVIIFSRKLSKLRLMSDDNVVDRIASHRLEKNWRKRSECAREREREREREKGRDMMDKERGNMRVHSATSRIIRTFPRDDLAYMVVPTGRTKK